MQRRTNIIAAAFLVTAIGCHRGSDASGPEAEIEAAIEAIEAASEAGDVAGVMAHVAAGYEDDYAGSRIGLQRLVQAATRQEFDADITIEEIDAGDDGYASVVVVGRFASESMGRATYRITSTWIDDDPWKVERASWQQR